MPCSMFLMDSYNVSLCYAAHQVSDGVTLMGGNRQSGDIAKGRSEEGQKQADQARQTRSGAG